MTEPAVTAVIDLDLPGPRISRHVYGHFAEHLGRCIYGGFWVGEDSSVPNDGGIRLDVVEALRALRIPNLRWPGGCFADDYHWRDGIGPREGRPRMVNSHWGDVVEDNAFGTHEFMHLCELLGAAPYVSGNVGSGTVREMSEWVEYLTRDDDSPMAGLRRENGRDAAWSVPFWGIGNEAWGCGGNMTASHFASLARQFGTYVRDHGGNTVERIAAGANSDDYAWTETLMRSVATLGSGPAPGSPYQSVSLHHYTINGSWEDKGDATRFGLDDYYVTLRRAHRIREIVRGHAAVMDAYDPARVMGLVVDEWGTWWNVEPGTNPGFLFQQNSLRDALVAAVHFDVFHDHAERVRMANIAQTVNVLQAVVLIDPERGSLVRTPTYHVFAMNTGHHDASALAVRLRGGVPTREVEGSPVPLFSASASTRGDTALVSLSNLDAGAPLTVALDLRGRAVADVAATVLTAPTIQSHNTGDDPDAVAPAPLDSVRRTPQSVEVVLPPHSYTTLALALA
ncbi:alpha-N-arabinofuranosidase [Microbacterium ulmi]|uniref:non-reducing end alpha-L-arabinofuranosidase n=1 Tax=Microbacterium ulmi TaxID=179095 RepID=A0A7Y2LZP1_9MICO|nr:alpha-L-arabinofuranosidase C-terminal domain-containing protein [Microbacterium ulmi]NII69896.1 alpha-N-arabinofuranosidase [Microbacterium ulmi]NNH03816.1 alpha-N-arabinofuranosidase [Microbacterium ulmi]